MGKEYEEEKANLCKCGFHACEYPLDCFSYYAPSDARYCEVNLDDVSDERKEDDSKRVGKKIHIKTEIGLPGIIKASVEYIKEQVDWENSKETNTGYQSAATNTGDCSAATVSGEESVAIATGIRGKARGAKGCFLVLAEWERDADFNWHIKDLKSTRVDGEVIKADTFYTLTNGEFVEAE